MSIVTCNISKYGRDNVLEISEETLEKLGLKAGDIVLVDEEKLAEAILEVEYQPQEEEIEEIMEQVMVDHYQTFKKLSEQ